MKNYLFMIGILLNIFLFASEDLFFIGEGKTTLSFIEDTSGEKHDLICHGNITIDDQSGILTFLSPDTSNSSAEKQVLFIDRMGEVRSDSLQMEYSSSKGRIDPQKMHIVGNVKILQNAPFDPLDKKPVLQYALADEVDFDPESQQMILRATEGRRVLFFDKIQDFKMSADEVIITRNPLTKKEKVIGKGRVRFTFEDEEFLRFKNIFHIGDGGFNE